jgi:DNA-binding CsgD family transcriptional regulator
VEFGGSAPIIEVFIYFTLHFPPVLYLHHYLSKYYVDFPTQEKFQNKFILFCSKFNISSREREILELLLDGKSNMEIEKELFISNNTVRNHIYNIYRKLGVRNRVQIVNLMQETIRNNEAG